MDPNDILTFLQSIEALRDVPREQLEWMVREAEVVSHEPGLWFRAGEIMDFMTILLEGEIQGYVIQTHQKKVQFTIGPGALSGLFPFSRMKSSPVYTEVLSPLKALALPKQKFHELVSKNYELTEAIVHAMTDRVRHFSTLHFQNEKLMSLGKLSAGLAHELNNPAAAIVRSAGDLKQTIGSLPSNLEAFATMELTPAEIAGLTPLLDKASKVPATRLPLLERKRQEDELTYWLDNNNVAIDCAETFVDFGLVIGDLEIIRTTVSERAFLPLVTWLANSLQAEKAVHEIETAARRISELVQSVKSYTRMDQVHDMQEVCINEGIRNTITMLEHKMRRNNITSIEDLAADLPYITGFPGELNQVWTNIIDNALDSMQKGGELVVRTAADTAHVYFIVIDTGPGIPPENLERIFDPFFTTKDVGEGTGVGLDLVQKIIQQHYGAVAVTSQPGRTEFRVSFPRAAVKQAGSSS
jgi:signal transduction histidine kinase